MKIILALYENKCQWKVSGIIEKCVIGWVTKGGRNMADGRKKQVKEGKMRVSLSISS